MVNDKYLFYDSDKKLEISKNIKETLVKEDSVVFAYIFGSFLGTHSFRDIDIAIYVKGVTKKEVFDYEIVLSKKISNVCGLSPDIFEIKVLNFTPPSFLNNIFRNGILLFSKDDTLLTDMIENTSLDAVANSYISNLSLKELVPK
jgi:uncharacterized protein